MSNLSNLTVARTTSLSLIISHPVVCVVLSFISDIFSYEIALP